MKKITQWVFLVCTLLFSTSAFAEIDLKLSMTADKTNVAIYKNVTYTLTITNDGNETATDIGVDFPLPPNTAYTGSTTSKGSYVHWTNTWTISQLAVGETATMDLVAFTLSNNVVRQAFAEVAKADQTDSDSTPNNNVNGFPVEDDEAELSVFYTSQVLGDLELSVVPNVSAYSTGDDVIYSLIMRNKGTTTTGPFRVQAYIPNALNANRYGGNGFYNVFNQTWTFNYDLGAGEATAMDIVGDALSMNQDLNSFFEIIAATNLDSDSTPNNDNGSFTADEDDEVFISLSPYTGPNESDLELSVNVNTFPATQTAEASFQAFITLRNRGPANNKQINIDIELPEEGIGNFEFSAPPHTAFNFAPNSTTQATWYNHFFADGEQDILLLTGTIEDETIPLTFYAEVRETPIPDPDSTPDNNSTQIPVEDDEAVFTIPPTNGTRPDLEVLILEITPISVQPGETIDLEFQVENIGGASAAASKVHIWVDDFYDGNPYHSDVIASLGIENISPLGIDEKETLNRTYTIPNNLPAGQYWVYIKADSDDEIEEDIEGNASVYFQRMTVGAMLPNIYVRDVNISPNALVAGTTVALSCEIFSNGAIPASTSKLEYYFSKDSEISPDDVLIGFDYVPLLEVGEGSQQSITYDLPLVLDSDSYYFIFLANAEKTYTESNETDNVLASQRFVSGQQADLYFTETFVWGQTRDSNSELALHSKVKNAGFVESPATTLNYYISQDQELDPSDILLGT
ncbi:MAG: CARDB domain-containing protein, partial [Chitinophagales bacterium]